MEDKEFSRYVFLVVLAVAVVGFFVTFGGSITGAVVKTSTGCVDSDGGQVFETRGTATINYSDGTTKGSTDSCICSKLLREYYCSGKSVAVKTQACNSCVQGACVGGIAPASVACTDTDGGKNLEVYGEVRVCGGAVNKDKCVMGNLNNPGDTAVPSCEGDGRRCKLQEWGCAADGTGYVGNNIVPVGKKCEAGKIVDVSCNPVAATCDTKGVSCPGNVEVQKIICGNGQACQNGACVAVQPFCRFEGDNIVTEAGTFPKNECKDGKNTIRECSWNQRTREYVSPMIVTENNCPNGVCNAACGACNSVPATCSQEGNICPGNVVEPRTNCPADKFCHNGLCVGDCVPKAATCGNDGDGISCPGWVLIPRVVCGAGQVCYNGLCVAQQADGPECQNGICAADCVPIEQNGNPENKLNIIFFPSHYYMDLGEFSDDVALFKTALFNFPFYAENRNKINLYLINRIHMDDGCLVYSPGRIGWIEKQGGIPICDPEKLKPLAKTCSFYNYDRGDQIVALFDTDNDMKPASARGHDGIVGIGSSWSHVFIHEVSHAFGTLGDSNSPPWTSNLDPQRVNCASDTPGFTCNDKWGDLIGQGEGSQKVGCFLGCGNKNWYRPTEDGDVMRSATLKFYDPVSLRHMKTLMERYT